MLRSTWKTREQQWLQKKSTDRRTVLQHIKCKAAAKWNRVGVAERVKRAEQTRIAHTPRMPALATGSPVLEAMAKCETIYETCREQEVRDEAGGRRQKEGSAGRRLK